MNKQAIFHLAIPISNVAQAKVYYIDGLGCDLGRESPHAVIFNFYGHQLTAHVTTETLVPQQGIYPRHFGLIFPQETDWEKLLHRAKQKQLKFYLDPKHRFPGQITEHRTFFLEDPFYNLLEFKFYLHSEAIFGAHQLTQVGER